MTSTQTGRRAEKAVAEHLQGRGHRIISMNWRTRVCEIDVISESRGVVYFVEVKYRANSTYGSGIEYVTPAKLKQMRFAAVMWVNEHNWQGEVSLMAASVSGSGFMVEEILVID